MMDLGGSEWIGEKKGSCDTRLQTRPSFAFAADFAYLTPIPVYFVARRLIS